MEKEEIMKELIIKRDQLREKLKTTKLDINLSEKILEGYVKGDLLNIRNPIINKTTQEDA